MEVIFINYNTLIDSSGIHIFHLANELETLGVRCTVCIPAEQDNSDVFGTPRFNIVHYDHIKKLSVLERIRLRTKDPIIHAWTPRENVRRLTVRLSRSIFSRYYVHTEDNEECILEETLKLPFSDIEQLPRRYLADHLTPDSIHPRKYGRFLRNAAGITCIIDTLENLMPQHVPKLTFWPSCEPEFYEIPISPGRAVHRSLGLPDDTVILGYTGNMHLNNFKDITNLYRAVGSLNEQGHKVKLLRSGTNSCSFESDVSSIQEKYVIDHGSVSARRIREIIAQADILVQPGGANKFNNYRFPSKLPMYLASGRPVVLPPTNLGVHLEDGHNCIYLRDASVTELVDRIKLLIDDATLRARIGQSGREFATNAFSWKASTRALMDFYADTGANTSNRRTANSNG